MIPFRRIRVVVLTGTLSVLSAPARQDCDYSTAFAARAPGWKLEPRVFSPSTASDRKAPDGTAVSLEPYMVTIPQGLLDERGTVALWIRLEEPLPRPKAQVTLFDGKGMKVHIQGRVNPLVVTFFFQSAMTGGKPASAFQALLTHLKADRWYYVAWTWDVKDVRRNGTFLDGVHQGSALPFKFPRHIKAATNDVTFQVGDQGVTVSALSFYEQPLEQQQLEAVCKLAGHKGYTDEGVRFTGEKFIPPDVDWDHPVYKTSFDDSSALRDWQLEGGRQMRVADGNLILEHDPQLDRETSSNHLVCWLTREVPADFLLEFTLRPQDRKCGLNIVFFNTRGCNGENIFESPIKPRDGTFKQYHSGDLDNYHISYWSGGRGTTNLRKNRGFHLVAIGRDLVYPASPKAFQTVRLYKRGGKIRLMVDDVVTLTYDDDGKMFGPVHDHSGWIGLRQMGRTYQCEYEYVKIFPLTQPPS